MAAHADLIKQTMESLDRPSMVEPCGLLRTDGKRPDCVTMISRKMGEQLVLDEYMTSWPKTSSPNSVWR